MAPASLFSATRGQGRVAGARNVINREMLFLQIQLLKWIDGILGRFAATVLPAAPAGEAVPPKRILVIRPGGIGDAVLLLPAIRSLKARFPEAELTVLAERRNGQVFTLCPAVDQLLLYESPADLLKLFRRSYDLVIDTEQWYRLSAVVGRLVNAPFSVGFATNERSRLFSRAIEYPRECYEALAFFRLLEPLQIAAPAAITSPFIDLPEPAKEEADRHLAPLSGRPFLTIFPGASVPEKTWGGDRFRELVSLLAARGVAAVMVGGDDARLAAREIAADGAVLDLVGSCSLPVSAAVIGKGRALVSGDSGLLHIAVALGVPTVSIFGPSDAVKWGPKGDADVIVLSGRDCAPCSRFGTVPPCPHGATCLCGVTVDRVFAAVEELLST